MLNRFRHRIGLRLLRRFNRFRRRVRRRYRRFCTSNPGCLLCNYRQRIYSKILATRDWFKKEVRRGRENVLMTNAHYWLWVLASAWLIVLGLHFVNTNFHLFSTDRLVGWLQGRHWILDFIFNQVRPLLAVVIVASARDILHEVCRVEEDDVRASRLIKRWLFFFGIFWFVCRGIHGRNPIVPPAVSDTTYTMLILLGLKWSIRKIRRTFGLPVGSVRSAKAKRAEGVLKDVVKFLVRSRLK